jgi:hypothetical protein
MAAAAIVVLTTAVLTGCGQPVDDPGSPVDGLRPCPAAGQVIGAFTARSTAEPSRAGLAAQGLDTWGLTVSGGLRRLTNDGVHTGAAISPDGRSIYQLRSSGRLLGDALEPAGVIERLDVATGRVSPVADLPGISDLTVSGDGRRLAAAHRMTARPDTGVDVNTVTVFELASPGTPVTLPRAQDARADLFSDVTEIALAPDGGRLAYALGIEVRRNQVLNTLRIRDLSTNADTVVHTMQGTDFISDVDWSPDGTTVLATVRYQAAEDTLESPSRFRTLRVDVASGRTTLSEGFAQEISPASADGTRLLGLAPAADAEDGARGRSLLSWDRGQQPGSRLPVDRGAAGLSVASCSYQ